MQEIKKHISNADVPRPSNEELVQMCSEIMGAIEKCGASPELTTAVIKASDLYYALRKPEPNAAAIRNAALEEAAEAMLPALRDMMSRGEAADTIRALKEQPPKEVQDALTAAESTIKTLRREKFDLESKLRRQEFRAAMQAEGKHPAPCASHCEATAFQIEIRSLKARIAELENARVTPAEWQALSNVQRETIDAQAQRIAELGAALQKLADLAEGFNVSGVYFSQMRENSDALAAADALLQKNGR